MLATKPKIVTKDTLTIPNPAVDVAQIRTKFQVPDIKILDIRVPEPGFGLSAPVEGQLSSVKVMRNRLSFGYM